jgi:hypothetical protein
LAAGAAALPVTSRFAWAQNYPTRPVRFEFGLDIPFHLDGYDQRDLLAGKGPSKRRESISTRPATAT